MYCSLHPYGNNLLNIESDIISRLADQGNGWAQFLKARHIADHKQEWEERIQDYRLPDEAFKEMLGWLQRAAHNGIALAQYWLARLYGDKDNPYGIYDVNESFRWLCAAEELPEAQYALAHYYALGRGTEQNPERAIHLLETAAAANLKDAILQLSHCYSLGLHVPQDRKKAEELENRVYGHIWKQFKQPKNQQQNGTDK